MEAPTFVAMDARWRAILRGESPAAPAARLARRPFGGPPWTLALLLLPCAVRRRAGARPPCSRYGQSRKNPHLCARCPEAAPGGAVILVRVLFADVRGYTSMTESDHPRDHGLVAALLCRRFGRLLRHEAVLGQIAGDEVMAIFVPGLAGAGYRTRAAAAGRSLLQAKGYTATGKNWLTSA